MKKKGLLLGLLGLLLTGCAATGNPDYVWVVDQDKVNKVIAGNYYSPHTVRTIWVNPPKKKVKAEFAEN